MRNISLLNAIESEVHSISQICRDCEEIKYDLNNTRTYIAQKLLQMQLIRRYLKEFGYDVSALFIPQYEKSIYTIYGLQDIGEDIEDFFCDCMELLGWCVEKEDLTDFVSVVEEDVDNYDSIPQKLKDKIIHTFFSDTSQKYDISHIDFEDASCQYGLKAWYCHTQSIDFINKYYELYSKIYNTEKEDEILQDMECMFNVYTSIAEGLKVDICNENTFGCIFLSYDNDFNQCGYNGYDLDLGNILRLVRINHYLQSHN